MSRLLPDLPLNAPPQWNRYKPAKLCSPRNAASAMDATLQVAKADRT